MAAASFEIDQDNEGRRHVRLLGQRSLRTLDNDFAELKQALQPFFSDPFTYWDLRSTEHLDTAGATGMLNRWQGNLDARMQMTEEQHALFISLQGLLAPQGTGARPDWALPLVAPGEWPFRH
jgi:phospholipid/cholesterol/gamma-HCH transport system permease protein